MTDQTQVPSGDDAQSSGQGANQSDNLTSKQAGEKSPVVPRDRYEALLNEKRNKATEAEALRKEVEELKAAEKRREEEAARKRGDTEKLLKIREEELKAKQTELETERQMRKAQDERLMNGVKLDAVLNAVGGKVDRKYWGLIPLEDVVVDQETGTPDLTSVQHVVKKFQESFPEVIVRATGTRLPSDAPKGTGAPMTAEVWKSLSLKEKRERYKEFMDSQLKKTS